MSGNTRARSARAAEASRRNGARSRGPRTAAGKARSAANSIRHGLFSASSGSAMPPSAKALAAELAAYPAGTAYAQMAIAAEAATATATAILEDLDVMIDALLEHPGSVDEVAALIEKRGRIGRYQRRFRGQRDRAVRKCMASDGSATG